MTTTDDAASDHYAERLRDELAIFQDFVAAPIFVIVGKDGAREREIVSNLVLTTTNLSKELAFAIREDNSETCSELVFALNQWKRAYKQARPMIAPVPGAGS